MATQHAVGYLLPPPHRGGLFLGNDNFGGV